ncbi:MAG: RES family NAD+ phosphorylase [Azonexus sp.]|nr:RES family NAD+ phosphorylase [Azonexus sp.]
MSANTWTPTALASEARHWSGKGWRAVEALHRVATMTLVHGDLDEQSLLEDILEEAKPVLPRETSGLHWLLATPFRYWPKPPSGSRCRARTDPGVFYGADEEKTACAECGYWRLRFWLDSEGLAGREASIPITLFEFHGATPQMLDLTAPPLVADHARWTDPVDYGATQKIAGTARQAGIQLIRYQSVRHPAGHCLAILTPQVFKGVDEAFRNVQHGWTLWLKPPGLTVWQRELRPESHVFRFA